VIRVRGKNIFWLSIMATLLAVMIVVPGKADVITTTLSVNPASITGVPGDVFAIDIDVTDVTDLYTFGFTLQFAPYARTLVVQKAEEGPFLSNGGAVDTEFASSIEVFEGLVHVTCTRLGPIPGNSGSGTLATITFKVSEAGDSVLDLVESKLHDSSPASLIPHNVVNGYYTGADGNMVWADLTGTLGDSHIARVGDTLTFNSRVAHDGEAGVSLKMYARYDLLREDGYLISLTSMPERHLYIPVSGFIPIVQDWATTGPAPWVDAVDGNTITSDTYCQLSAFYTFDGSSVVMDPDEYIAFANIEAYASGDPDIDGDIYFSGWGWLGSIECPSATEMSWVPMNAEVTPMVQSAADVDAILMYLHYWTPTGDPLGPFVCDAIRLHIVISYLPKTVASGATVDLPTITYVPTASEKGKYYVTATVFYSGTYPAVGYLFLAGTPWVLDPNPDQPGKLFIKGSKN
jgi:hypothetical protein